MSKKKNKDKIVFISGPITNEPNYKENFKNAKKHLKSLGYKHIINPVKLQSVLPEKIDYDAFLKIDLAVLAACDVIYLLNNWDRSNGASTEMKFAQDNGLEILFEPWKPIEV